MQAKPKRTRKHAFPYLLLGLLIGLALVVLVSAIWLISLNTPVTVNNIVRLHLTFPLFLFIDFLVLAGSLMFGWVGLEKDRVEDAKRRAEKLAQSHQLELQQFQGTQVELEDKHQSEIVQLNEQLNDEGKKFQELEAIIRRGKQQWQGTFDAVDDLIVLTDESGVILRCNRATGEAFQSGYSQIVGQKIDDLFLNSSDNPQAMVPGEKREIKGPGLEVWYEASKNHLLVDGKQEGWVYIFRNVTHQKQVLQDQQRLTHYYELLVNNSPIAIVTLNMEDRIIDCNPAFEALFLYNKRESLGWKIDLLVSPPDLSFETQGISEAVRKGETVHCITQRKRKDGSLLDVEVFGIPVIMGGKQVGSLGLYHDISALVSSEQSLVEAAAPVLMAKSIEDALSSQPVAEGIGGMEAPEEVEALPLQDANLEPGGDEEGGELQQSGEALVASPPVQIRKRLTPIESIEGIGPIYKQKLAENGVKYTHDLLELGKSRKGREELVEKTGISATLVLKWVNMADLMRVHGIGEEYSELLEKAGVDTVKELRNRNPHHLHEALIQANVAHKLVRRAPHLSEVEDWVKEAKELPPIMAY